MTTMNNHSFSHLQKHELMLNLPPIHAHDDLYEVCQLGKQSRLSLLAKSNLNSIKKDTTCSYNVFEPMKTVFKCKHVFILFISDFSRISWVYFLKQKSKLVRSFWKFKVWIEDQSDCKIYVIRSNWTECTSNRFEEFCVVAGMVMGRIPG